MSTKTETETKIATIELHNVGTSYWAELVDDKGVIDASASHGTIGAALDDLTARMRRVGGLPIR